MVQSKIKDNSPEKGTNIITLAVLAPLCYNRQSDTLATALAFTWLDQLIKNSVHQAWLFWFCVFTSIFSLQFMKSLRPPIQSFYVAE